VSGAGDLRVRDLVVRFAGQAHPLFSIAALDLSSGSSLGISGISGAGKTTLFHCLAGIARPSAGLIDWGGTEIVALAADALCRWRRRHLGLVFQDFHLVEGLSMLDNVLLPACFDRWNPTPALRQRARDLLAAVGLSAWNRMTAVLSRGERQRVALARALLLQPAIVMADEPTASLDPDHRTQIGDLLVELVRAEGATLLVVTHEQELLLRMDRCVRLAHGALHESSAS
jgi:putative ABC transport system ATP-binding protein